MAGSPLALLMMATLVAAWLIGLILLARHMRKPANRHPMDGQRERNIEEIRRERPEG